MLVAVKVGAAIARPPTSANIRFTHVVVEAQTELEAELIAAQMVASRDAVDRIPHGGWEPSFPLVEMPTSTEIVELFSL